MCFECRERGADFYARKIDLALNNLLTAFMTHVSYIVCRLKYLCVGNPHLEHPPPLTYPTLACGTEVRLSMRSRLSTSVITDIIPKLAVNPNQAASRTHAEEGGGVKVFLTR